MVAIGALALVESIDFFDALERLWKAPGDNPDKSQEPNLRMDARRNQSWDGFPELPNI